jgi:hypothetical protein
LEIQEEALWQREEEVVKSRKKKGKERAIPPVILDEDAETDDDEMDVDVRLDSHSESGTAFFASDKEGESVLAINTDAPLVPMAVSGGIEELRAKLHAKMAALRRGAKPNAEPGTRDELLEERRRQHAEMRERRRKETKEKIRRQEEMKHSKGKQDKGKHEATIKGPTTKVSKPVACCNFFFNPPYFSNNYSFPTTLPAPLILAINSRVSRSRP